MNSHKLNVEKSLRTATAASLLFALVKAIAFFGSGSLLVLASLFDSLADAVVSYANSRIHGVAMTDADAEHPYGHGGVEVLAALIQGFMISFFCLIVVTQSVTRLMNISTMTTLELSGFPFAIGTMVASGVFAYGLHTYLAKKINQLTSQNQRSLSLLADHAHYAGDAQMNLAGAAGLLIVWVSGWEFLDAIFAIAGATLAFRAVLPTLTASVRDILHTHAGGELDSSVAESVLQTDERILGIHRLRTRRLGPVLFIDFHLKLNRALALEEAHHIGESVANNLRAKFPSADINIHLDPDSEPDDDYWPPKHPVKREELE